MTGDTLWLSPIKNQIYLKQLKTTHNSAIKARKIRESS